MENSGSKLVRSYMKTTATMCAVTLLTALILFMSEADICAIMLDENCKIAGCCCW